MKVNEVIVVYAAITVKEPANEMATVEVSVIRKSERDTPHGLKPDSFLGLALARR